MAEKIKVSKPKIKILESVRVDPKRYKKGSYGGGRSDTRSRGICGCNACQELLRLVAGETDSKAGAILEKYAASAERVKMSIQVDKPGFFALSGLKDKTDNKFGHVFFPEAGRYSLVSIYKHCRAVGRKFPDGPLTPRLKRKLSADEAAEFSSVFGGVIPLGVSSRTRLEKDIPIWKDIEASIISAIRGEVDIAPSYNGVFVIFDRYIPLLINGGITYRILEDATPVSKNLIPGLETDKDTGSRAYIGEVGNELLNLISGGNTNILFAGFDIVENKLVYSLEIAEVIHSAIKGNLDAFKAIGDVAEFVEALPGPKTFVDKLNENFAKMGAIGFEAISVAPNRWKSSYLVHDFANGNGEYEYADEICYFVNVDHNGKRSIGRGNGYIFVRTNEALDEFILVQSTWCQRVSSWSKNVEGVVDQHYNIWPIADWLSGPWAEKQGYNKKALVFSGNKNRTSKTDVLAELRNRLKAKMG